MSYLATHEKNEKLFRNQYSMIIQRKLSFLIIFQLIYLFQEDLFDRMSEIFLDCFHNFEIFF